MAEQTEGERIAAEMLPPSWNTFRPQLAAAIDKAIADERERCAKVADAKGVEYKTESDAAEQIKNNYPNFWAARARTASTIAAAIRKED